MKSWRDVLVYGKDKADRAKIKRYYRQYRTEAGIPVHCDNSECRFHSEPLIGNGRELPLILDHRDGNPWDNRPEMLRYLCPNCDAQLPTRGGSNKGRMGRRGENEFVIRGRDGAEAVTVFGSGGMVAGGTAPVHCGTSAGETPNGEITAQQGIPPVVRSPWAPARK